MTMEIDDAAVAAYRATAKKMRRRLEKRASEVYGKDAINTARKNARLSWDQRLVEVSIAVATPTDPVKPKLSGFRLRWPRLTK